MKSVGPFPALRVHRPPPRLRKELEHVLISRAQLHRRVQELAAQIELDFTERDLVVVSLSLTAL